MGQYCACQGHHPLIHSPPYPHQRSQKKISRASELSKNFFENTPCGLLHKLRGVTNPCGQRSSVASEVPAHHIEGHFFDDLSMQLLEVL
jgi:hypothetical protein